MSKDYYSTGTVAKMCGVAPRTIAKWAEKALLKFYRIPGLGHRRFHKDEVARFMRERGMDRPVKEYVAVILRDTMFIEDFEHDWVLHYTTTLLHAGALLEKHKPQLCIVDVDKGLSDIAAAMYQFPDTKFVALVGEEFEPSYFDKYNFARVITKPHRLYGVLHEEKTF